MKMVGVSVIRICPPYIFTERVLRSNMKNHIIMKKV